MPHGLRGRRPEGHRLPLSLAACVRQPADARPGDGGLDRAGSRSLRRRARAGARRHRRAALPARQLQRFLGPVDLRRSDGGPGRGDCVFARLSLGHFTVAGRHDHARAADGPARHHLSRCHLDGDERRDDQDRARGRGRQPVQPGPVLPAGGRHEASSATRARRGPASDRNASLRRRSGLRPIAGSPSGWPSAAAAHRRRRRRSTPPTGRCAASCRYR